MIVGILGAGQLGRMLALAGYPLGLRFRCLDPAPDAAAGQLAQLIVAPYDNAHALERLAAGAAAVTYEFENVPLRAAEFLAAHTRVLPPPVALATSQDRLLEKQLFTRLGIPTPAFEPVDSQDQLRAAIERVGLPAVLKSRCGGYDGKGQQVIREAADVNAACARVGGGGMILEQFVSFRRELSIVAVRGRQGGGSTTPGTPVAFYPLVENHHRNGILALSLAPAPRLTPELQALAEFYATRVLDALDYVGVLAIEFFETAAGLVANEMAPRVHNSGHWTIEGAKTSQFENHLRAILGWPLGSTEAVGSSAMVNLIGEMPDPAVLLAVPGAHLHLYGKSSRPGRKVGHVTLWEQSDEPDGERLSRLLRQAGIGEIADRLER
ncbi:MAG: 5-(carboxyamino)imidazole ribonucleotide synthase [Phycisphaerae bacterium]